MIMVYEVNVVMTNVKVDSFGGVSIDMTLQCIYDKRSEYVSKIWLYSEGKLCEY